MAGKRYLEIKVCKYSVTGVILFTFEAEAAEDLAHNTVL